MARPTNDKKDKTLILRVNAETKEQIEKRAKLSGKSISDYVRDEILGENNVIQNEDDVIQNIMDKAVYKDINDMCRSCQISTHDFYRGVCDLWNSGKLFIEDGKVKSKGEWDLDMFVERCHFINEYPQDVIDKVTKGLR